MNDFLNYWNAHVATIDQDFIDTWQANAEASQQEMLEQMGANSTPGILPILYISLGVLFVLFLIWHLCTKKYINPYKQYLYIGVKGTGKSTTMTKKIYQYMKKGYDVYTDALDIRIPGLRIIDINDVGAHYAENSVFFIDELALYFSNRNFMDKEYRKRTEAFLKWLHAVRHDRCTVYLFSQDYKVDAQIRNQCDKIVILFKYFRVFTVGRMLSKDTVIKDTATDADSQIAQQLQYVPIFMRGALEITYIPRWAKMFDSYKDILPGRTPLPYKVVKEDGEISETTEFWHK